MALFNIFKKKNEVKDTSIEEKKEDNEEKIESKKEDVKKFSLICINMTMEDYSFVMQANNNGDIIIDKGIIKDEFNDKQKTSDLYDMINDNLSRFKEYASKEDKNPKGDLIRIEINNEKIVLFKNKDNDDMSLFYDMIIHEITTILNINKIYENIKENFSFEYLNSYEKIPTDDLDKYCLLANSTPLIMLNDSSNNIITFELLANKEGIVDKIIDDINNSGVYQKVSSIDLDNDYFKVNCEIVNYVETNKIEALAFIMFDGKCVLLTMGIGLASDVDVDHLLKNNKIKEMMSVIKSFKILDEDIINS